MFVGNDKRAKPRQSIVSLPGRLVTARDRREITCTPLDVSQHGLGILTSENLLPETGVILLTEKVCIYLTMVRCQITNRGLKSSFHYGFKALEAQINLIELCTEHGCIAEPIQTEKNSA